MYKGYLEYFDYFISNEEVNNHKPNPEIYNKCIERSKLKPYECLILEDSPIGKEAAILSGCHLCPINDPEDLTLQKIMEHIQLFESKNAIKELCNKWDGNLNIVIPMAGLGSRFSKAGYTFPKPLIDINGKPMIQLVVENLNIKANYIFIVQQEHYTKYCLKYLLNLIAPNCTIICIEKVTEGAACTVLLAKEYINKDTPLLIANSDQFLEWNSSDFLYSMNSTPQSGIDGGILTFESLHPKWSYVKLNQDGYVELVKEKEVISNIATTGIYYWSKGSNFVFYAEQMIQKNIRVNNEFYVAPVYNEAIQDKKKIKIKNCDAMYGLGTPEDLNTFLQVKLAHRTFILGA
jgi:dTDP-glucose pyrophosphorylase